jgi:hypothetical protein
MSVTDQIDWNAVADKARGMTVPSLLGAISDILATLSNADSIDRETGSCRGGYYRDEISIYRKELSNRDN